MEHISYTKVFRDRNLIVKGADAATRSGWTGVPNFILESDKLSPGAKLTYAMLLKYAREEDECFPGQKRLGDDMGTSERSVRTWLKELQKHKLVTSKRRGQGKSNLYTVHLKASFWSKPKHTR
ncbi:MAG: helix-turn-helix domain-containing protein [Anaerolineae bacterium]